MQARGYAGDVTPSLLVYVAATSRLLERPQNVACVAQSGAAKNRAVDAALELLPPEAYYLERAGSTSRNTRTPRPAPPGRSVPGIATRPPRPLPICSLP